MTPSFENLRDILKRLPGLGYRSAERLALHLLVEKPDSLPPLRDALDAAAARITRCRECGNLCEEQPCPVCADERRDPASVCIVENVPDLLAIERAGVHRGRYVVLHGKLSPLHGIGPEDLNLEPLRERLRTGLVREIILALPNDIEGQATCHYLQEEELDGYEVSVSRPGFGLPSAGEITFADAATLKSAFEGRRQVE